MVNVAVINLKDLIKYSIKLILILLIITFIGRYIKNMKQNEGSKINYKFSVVELEKKISGSALETALPNLSKNEKQSKKESNFIEEILNSQFGMKNSIVYVNNLAIDTTQLTNDDIDELVIQNEVKTEVINENNMEARYTNTYGNIQIKNESKYALTDEILNPNIEFSNSKNVIIFHTHTCESYTQTEESKYESTGNYRTTNLDYSVARVGTELTNMLIEKGFNVIHDVTYNDYPAYSGSYNRSLKVVENLLSNNNAELVFDIHRDAVGSNSNYAPTVKIGDEIVAQLMFVIGTDGGGLDHPNWTENLKTAIKIQEKANELYPGLFRPIILRNSRYNQHLARGASIIEVGATGNTLEQCNLSMKYLSNVLSEVF